MEAWRPEDLSVTLLASKDRTEGLTARRTSRNIRGQYWLDRVSQTVPKVLTAMQIAIKRSGHELFLHSVLMRSI